MLRASAAMARSPSGGTVYAAWGPKPTWSRSSFPAVASATAQAPANSASQLFPGPPPGTSKMAGVYWARIPASSTASTTPSGCRYCSHVVVTPLPSSSAAPSSMPQ